MDIAIILMYVGVAFAGAGLFTSLWVLRNRVDGKVPDRLLALLLLLCSMNVLHPFMEFLGASRVPRVIEPIQFLLPIGLLWYLRALRGTRVIRGFDAVVLGLPLVFIVVSNSPLVSDAGFGVEPQLFSLVMWLTMAGFSSVLLVPVAAEITHYRKDLKTVYSNLSGIDPGWLRRLLAALVLLFFVYALLTVFIVHAPSGFPVNRLLGFLMGVLTIHLSWMSLRRKPRIASEIAEKNETAAPPKEWGEWGVLIRQRLEASRLFLDPELTLDALAKQAGLTRHETSAALNRGLGVSFFDLVNALRVAEFQKLCRDPDKKDEKILTLALESGFNSKPAFNLIFKKATGRTPSEYRKSAEIESKKIA